MWPACPWEKNLSKNLFEEKKERKKPNKKHVPENASTHVGKIQNTRQSAASVHGSWTLLQVANVHTHQLIEQMSSDTRKEHVGKKNNMRHNIPYIDKCAKNKNYCFARVPLHAVAQE